MKTHQNKLLIVLMACVSSILLAACGDDSCPAKRNLDAFKKNAQKYQDENEKIKKSIQDLVNVHDAANLSQLYTQCQNNLQSAQSIKTTNEDQVDNKNNFLKSLARSCEILELKIASENEKDGLKKLSILSNVTSKRIDAIVYNPFSTEVTCKKSVMQEKNSSNVDEKKGVNLNPDEQRIADMAKKIILKKWDWNSGYGTSFNLNAILVNENEFSVKDIGIYCVTSGKSGTKLTEVVQTVYEVIAPSQQLKLKNFSMGSINSQSNNAQCIVFSAVKVD